MTTAAEPLLLDTHVWVWLNEGTTILSDAVTRRIDRAAARGGAFDSVISVWEVSRLLARWRVVLGLALPLWVERALAPPLALAPLTPEIAATSCRTGSTTFPSIACWSRRRASNASRC